MVKNATLAKSTHHARLSVLLQTLTTAFELWPGVPASGTLHPFSTVIQALIHRPLLAGGIDHPLSCECLCDWSACQHTVCLAAFGRGSCDWVIYHCQG